MQKLKLRVKSNDLIADHIYSMDLICEDFDINNFKAGQFLHIKCGAGIDPLLRRPISICDIDTDNKIINIIYRKEGKGTAILAEMRAGDITDCLGPLGNGFTNKDVQIGQTVLMVGGGIGVPPLYHLAKELKSKGAVIKSIIGFNSGKDVFLEKEFAELGDVHVTTMDGSAGHHGMVTDLFDTDKIHSFSEKTKLESDETSSWDRLYTCGPTAMLAAIQKVLSNSNKPAYMSLEERMACGLGACLACVCHPTETKKDSWEKSYKKICCDGPVFELQEVTL